MIKCKTCNNKSVIIKIKDGVFIRHCTRCGYRREMYDGGEYRIGYIDINSSIDNPKWLFEMPFEDDEDESIDLSDYTISYEEEEE